MMHVCGPGTGVLLVLLLRAELWFPALATVAAVAVVLHRVLQDRRLWLPALLAARAVTASSATSFEVASEGSAAELAVLARGRRGVLDRAASLAHEEPDVERWSRVIARITVAGDLLERGAVPGVPSPRERRLGHIALWLAAAVASLVLTVLTSSRWWLFPLVASYTVAILLWTERCEDRDWGPALVLATATSSAVTPGAPEELVVAHLTALARGSVEPVRRARELVETWPGSKEKKARGTRRLTMAELMLSSSGLAAAAARRRVSLWMATLLIITVAWVVSG